MARSTILNLCMLLLLIANDLSWTMFSPNKNFTTKTLSSVNEKVLIFYSVNEKVLIFYSVNEKQLVFNSVNEKQLVFYSVNEKVLIFYSMNENSILLIYFIFLEFTNFLITYNFMVSAFTNLVFYGFSNKSKRDCVENSALFFKMASLLFMNPVH